MNKAKATCLRCYKEVRITEHFRLFRHNIIKGVVCQGSSESCLDQTSDKCKHCGEIITFSRITGFWNHKETGLEPPMTFAMEICGKPEPVNERKVM